MKTWLCFLVGLSASASALCQVQPPSPLGLAAFDGGAGAVKVAGADFTEDGLVDLVYLTRTSREIHVVAGTGVGRFTPLPPHALALLDPLALAVDDFDLDGKEDLAVLDEDTGTIRILLGNGAGGFVSGPALAAAPGSLDVVSADLDLDGRPDVVAANASPAGARIFLGVPGGGFAVPADFVLSSSPRRVLVTQLDADGQPDLAVMTATGVWLCLADGQGSFRRPRALGVSDPEALAAADVDEDGDVDLVVARRTGLEFTVWHQVSPGSFQLAQVFQSAPVTVQADELTLADFDSDGSADLAVVDGNSIPVGNIALFANQSNGLFDTAPRRLPLAGQPSALFAADLNGDLRMDFAATNVLQAYGYSLVVREGDGALGGLFDSAVVPPSPPVYAAAADMNGDGHLDVATLSWSPAMIEVLLGDGRGGLQHVHTEPALLVFPQGFAAGDVDGDSHPDLVGTDYGTGGRVLVYFGDGSGGFSSTLVLDVGGVPRTPRVADLDLDGDGDLVYSASPINYVTSRLFDGNGGFLPPKTVFVDGSLADIQIVDVDADLLPDLLTVKDEAFCVFSNASFFRGDGAGGFIPKTVLSACNPGSIAAADVDSDGDQDLIVANRFGTGTVPPGQLLIFLASSPGAFGAAVPVSLPGEAFSAAPADFDGDGILEILVRDGFTGLHVVRWTGNAFAVFSGSLASYGVALPGDMNEDGRSDLLIAASVNGGRVQPLLNRGDAGTPLAYCTAKVNSLGCTPAIGGTGSASASAGNGFVVEVANVRNQKNGFLFYGTSGPQAFPLLGGRLCLRAPLKRTQPVNAHGNPLPANDCTGVLAMDFNALIASGSGLPALQIPGTVVQCQWWARDQGFPPPLNCSLSDALTFVVQP